MPPRKTLLPQSSSSEAQLLSSFFVVRFLFFGPRLRLLWFLLLWFWSRKGGLD